MAIHEVGEHVGQHYFVMRFVEGGNLSSRLKEFAVSEATDKADAKKRLVRAAELTLKIARAVHHAHQRGILHRDLKPANIIVDPAGEPHVTDFGLSRRIDEESALTATGIAIGTPSYMAPEQVRGTDITIQADVYGLGTILYELLTGVPPFKGGSPMETMLNVRDREPVRPHSVCRRIPRDLETICLKCLQKHARSRYATAEYVADDLRRFLVGEPIHARAVGNLRRCVKWARRRPTVAALWAAVLLIAVAGMAGVTWAWQRAETALSKADRSRQLLVVSHAAESQARILAIEQRQRAERTVYFQKIGLAHRDWQAGKVASAEQILDSCAPEFRSWEWYYLKRLCHCEIMKFEGHTGSVAAIAYNSDGSRLASASGAWGCREPSEIRIWDTATGKQVAVCNGHTEAIRGIAFSPDGKRLVSGSWDRSVRIWDAQSGEQIRQLQKHTNDVHAVAFSPDGHYVASGSTDQTVIVWNADEGRIVHIFARLGQTIHCVAFSPDSQRVAAGGWEGILQEWQIATKKELHRVAGMSDIRSLAYSPDGKRIASGGYDRAVTIWNLAGMNATVTFTGHTAPVLAVAYSPDGLQLASADAGGDVKVWEAHRGRALWNVRGHTGAIGGLNFHPTGRHLAYGGEDRAVRIWDLTRDPESRASRERFTLTGSMVFDDSRRLFGISGLNWRSRSRMMMVSEMDTATSRQFGDRTNASVVFSSMAYCPKNQLFVLGCEDGNLRLGSAPADPVLYGHVGRVNSVSLRSDGLEAASGGTDGTVRVWEMPTGKQLVTLLGHTDKVHCVAYHPGGMFLASAGSDRTVRLWNAGTGEEVAVLSGHDGPIVALAFSPDGKSLASAGDDKTILIWDMDTIRNERSKTVPQLTLQGHVATVTGLVFTSDNRRLISSSLDWTLKLWDVATGQQALTLHDQSAAVYGVALSPDDRYLVSATIRLRIWEGGTSPEQIAGTRVPSAAEAASWNQRQARAAELARNWYAVVFHCTSGLRAQFLESFGFNRRGMAYAELGRWPEAVQDFGTATLLRPSEPSHWYALALSQCASGDDKAYRRTLDKMYQRFSNTGNIEAASELLSASLPAAGAIRDRASLLRLGKLARNNGRLYAATLCRAGEHEQAVRAFKRGGWELRGLGFPLSVNRSPKSWPNRGSAQLSGEGTPMDRGSRPAGSSRVPKGLVQLVGAHPGRTAARRSGCAVVAQDTCEG